MELAPVRISPEKWRLRLVDSIRTEGVLWACSESTRFVALLRWGCMPHIVLVADLRVGSLVAVCGLCSRFDLIRESSRCTTHATHSHSVLIFTCLSGTSADLVATTMRGWGLFRFSGLLGVHPVLPSNSKRWRCSTYDGISYLRESVGTATLQGLASRVIGCDCTGNSSLATLVAASPMLLDRLVIIRHHPISDLKMHTLRMLIHSLRFEVLLNHESSLLLLMRHLWWHALKPDHV